MQFDTGILVNLGKISDKTVGFFNGKNIFKSRVLLNVKQGSSYYAHKTALKYSY
jgi:hypothetical protein